MVELEVIGLFLMKEKAQTKSNFFIADGFSM